MCIHTPLLPVGYGTRTQCDPRREGGTEGRRGVRMRQHPCQIRVDPWIATVIQG